MSRAARERGAERARTDHRNGWIFTLIVGAILIAIGNLLPVPDNWLEVRTWLIALLVSAAMLLFAYVVRDTEVSNESKGDSLYYLGLLFTFGALVAALVAFTTETGTEGTADIIRNFGIALLTTIVGLAGRVWYAMLQDAPGDLEEMQRKNLEEAVAEMKGSLNRARDELDLMVGKFQDSAREMTDAATGIAEEAARTGKTLQSLLARATESLSSASDRASDLDNALAGGTEAARSFRESVRTIVEPSTALAQDLAAASAQVHSFNDTLARAQQIAEPTVESIRAISDGLVAAAARTESLNETIAGVEDQARLAGAAVSESATRAQTAIANVQATEREMGQLQNRIRDLARNTETTSVEFDSVGRTAEETRSHIAAMSRNAQALDDRITADRSALAEKMKSVRARTDRLDSELAELGEQSWELSGVIDTAKARANALARDLGNTGARTGRRGRWQGFARWIRRRVFRERTVSDRSDPPE